jgi:hypothetical protein
VYGAYVAQKLADEDARQSSIEQRGLAVITTAGVLTTALFGIATFINPKSGIGIPHAAHGPLVVAIIMLVLSALLAIATNVPLGYETVTTEDLQGAVTDLWGENPNDAMQRVSVTHVKEIKSARSRNTTKAWLLVGAMLLESLGLGFLFWAVYEVVNTH